MSGPRQRTVVLAGILGILGAALVGAGEFSLHYTPTHEYHDDYHFFLGIPGWRLTLGHFLSILSVPLYFVGYWHVFQCLRPAAGWLRRLFFGIGVYSFAVGGVWIGSRAYLALLIQAQEAHDGATREALVQLLETASFYNEQLILVLRVAILISSGLFVVLTATGRTSYPRWAAFFNPILLVAAAFGLYFTLPAIGGYVMPIAMNVAHVIFFSVSTWLCTRMSADKFA